MITRRSFMISCAVGAVSIGLARAAEVPLPRLRPSQGVDAGKATLRLWGDLAGDLQLWGKESGSLLLWGKDN